MERTSVQRAFRWLDARVSLINSTLCAAEPLMPRCPYGCHPMPRGPWVPAFAGKTRGRKAGARRHGGAAATAWTSAQRALRQHDVRAFLQDGISLLRGAQSEQSVGVGPLAPASPLTVQLLLQDGGGPWGHGAAVGGRHAVGEAAALLHQHRE